jgi:hypothetical protein
MTGLPSTRGAGGLRHDDATGSRAPEVRAGSWEDLRSRATEVFLFVRAGWMALSETEREEVQQLVGKSRGRVHRLTRAEARRLGTLAAHAARRARESRSSS